MTETAKAIGVTKGAVSQALKGNKIVNKLFYIEIKNKKLYYPWNG